MAAPTPTAPSRRPCRSAKAQVSLSRSGSEAGVADRVAGEQHHVPLDPVADERAPVGAEEVLRVAAELEERERVAAVRADELVGEARCSGGLAGRRERPEGEVGEREQPAERDRAGRERQPGGVVPEGDRALPPEQQVGGLVRDEARRVDVGDRHDEPADEGNARGRCCERAQEDAAARAGRAGRRTRLAPTRAVRPPRRRARPPRSRTPSRGRARRARRAARARPARPGGAAVRDRRRRRSARRWRERRACGRAARARPARPGGAGARARRRSASARRRG